ncbi:diacylglycerol/polyprenol kinase family protein [Methanobacterium alcaliphilum]|uniref:diacylglycerol/polyprenol kinase family protein n=1 Tax=Methanobacterium alcaliphilum TaxID=392018 RepID=UPI00200A6991|nr:phosphatidate cytidylyltransferase [Methanobacterium alcaliphilum]MCK9151093.1 phosphatidate cytidylyltransferase [Methanobacterium alcaliphilum]
MQVPREIVRQLIHASGILFILLESFLKLPYLIIVALFAALAGEIIYQLDKKKYLPFFSRILRNCRRDNLERGFIHFFLALTLTFSIFGTNLAVVNTAIIILVLGDSASTVIGTRYGKKLLPFSTRKTWAGSSAFFILGFLGALTQIPLYASFLGALAGTITEAYSPVDDNLTIPLAVGATVSITMLFL